MTRGPNTRACSDMREKYAAAVIKAPHRKLSPITRSIRKGWRAGRVSGESSAKFAMASVRGPHRYRHPVVVGSFEAKAFHGDQDGQCGCALMRHKCLHASDPVADRAPAASGYR